MKKDMDGKKLDSREQIIGFGPMYKGSSQRQLLSFAVRGPPQFARNSTKGEKRETSHGAPCRNYSSSPTSRKPGLGGKKGGKSQEKREIKEERTRNQESPNDLWAGTQI